MDKCPYCSAETRPGDMFCLNCGNRLIATTFSTSTSYDFDEDSATIPVDSAEASAQRETVHMKKCPFCRAGARATDEFCLNCGNPLIAPMPATPAPSAVLHSRYHVLGILRQGGMSTVYRAEDNNLGQRLVAVKEIKLSSLQSPEEIDKVLSAFEQEALLLAKLSHPYLPSIYDHFSDNEHWYIVMQYIRGETLGRCLHALPAERVTIEDVLKIAIKLCEVLSYLHTQTPPVIFSDLKPDNIMLTPEGNLYLIDFGIARLFVTTLADDRKFVSQGYSPPEQYQSAQLSPRADIYSLGATLHQLLSGLHPSKVELKFPPLQLGQQLWAIELETLVLSMLKQNEEERPPNITVVKQSLQRITELRIQEQNLTADSSTGDQGISVWDILPWETPPLVSRNMPTEQAAYPVPNRDSAATAEVSPLPASVSSREIRLSLGAISALAWSPDGSSLAAANGVKVHIYAWPPEENEFTFEDEPLIPLRIWSLEDLPSWEDKKEATSPPSQDLPSWEGGDCPFCNAKTKPGDIFCLNCANRLTDEGSKSIVTFDVDWMDVSTIPIDEGMDVDDLVTMAWSPDGTHLAVTGGALKSGLIILDTSAEDLSVAHESQKSPVGTLSWSPDGNFLASGGHAHTAVVQEVKTCQNISSKLHTSSVTAVAWSPDSTYLASASTDGSVQVWEAASEREICEYHGHSEYVYDLLWASDGTYIISCGVDHTIQVWDAQTASKIRSLEGHAHSVQCISFLDQGRLLASLSSDGTVCVWRTDTWALAEKFKTNFYPVLRNIYVAFHPSIALLAKSTRYEVITVYEIDIDQVYNGPSKAMGIQYTNAKVVLLGDSGVGKTGLGLVLSRQSFKPTESTHGRTVWTFARRERKLDDGRKEIRETFLWDLAGQPGYRLIHQLHLSEVAAALVVFDAHSETDPFAGISHWVRALRTAQRVKGNMGAMKMMLVLARIDRGGKRVSHERIDELIQKMGFEGYYETSAKEGTAVPTLATGIMKAIDWEQLPKVTSTDLFQRINSFLIGEKQAGRLLSTSEDLYLAFSRTNPQDAVEDLSAEFVTGIRLLESTGLIRQLRFGNLVLLQPELLDIYASALVNAVRDEPDGLGSISEEAVHAAAFPIPSDERIPDSEQERLLLIAMVQDLFSYEIALREKGEDGPYLVFPSESTRENPALSDPENASIVFTFEGPVLNIYATLAVRLSHTGLFAKRDLWKNAIIYDARLGGICGMWLKVIEDGKGELTLFFDGHPSEETCFHFEEYVRVHLQRKALPESITSRCIHRCECGFVASEQLVRMRTERKFNWFNCPVCGKYVDLRDHEERLRSAAPSRVPEMDRAADIQRARATAQSTVQGKQEIKEFDVFLCYNSADRSTVIEIGERLKERGILPWLDEWELRPGLPWQRLLGQQIEQIKSAAVFVGKGGVGPWQEQELEAFLRQFVRRGCPVIPVILNDAPGEPELPIFLEGMRWVDFRPQASIQDIGPMEQLIWGITGKRRSSR